MQTVEYNCLHKARVYKKYRTNNARTKLKMRPWIYKIASFALSFHQNPRYWRLFLPNWSLEFTK